MPAVPPIPVGDEAAALPYAEYKRRVRGSLTAFWRDWLSRYPDDEHAVTRLARCSAEAARWADGSAA